MKHKHYDMIVAKAANMDLVTFYYTPANNEWKKQLDQFDMDFEEGVKYFLCLPQHNENGQCLHWLNGGALQDFFEGSWTSIGDFEGEGWVEADNMFMNEEYQLRIKPKKEKRWIGVYTNGETTNACLLKREAQAHPLVEIQAGWQFIEIEVEV